jgi:hypothetical protein
MAGAASLFGQAPDILPLPRLEVVPAEGALYQPPIIPVKCDPSGNIYYRPAMIANPNDMGRSPVVRISADGRKTMTFDISGAPELSKSRFSMRDFAVSPGGEVYFLGTDFDKRRVVIAKFDSDGRYSSTIAVEPKFVPSRLVPLGDGGFLVAGSEEAGAGDAPKGMPVTTPRAAFTGILDQSGRLVYRVTLKDDSAESRRAEAEAEKPKPEKAAEASAPKGAAAEEAPRGGAAAGGTPPKGAAAEGAPPKGAAAEKAAPARSPADQWAEILAFTKMVASSDGNAYLMRPSSPPLVYVISPAGEVLRRLTLEGPGNGLEPVDIAVDGLRIAVFFARVRRAGAEAGPPQQVYALFDAMTGERVASYSGNATTMSGSAVCYSMSEGFTFLGRGANGRFEIIHAKP